MSAGEVFADRQRDAAYYDDKFSEDLDFGLHYTESTYFGLWATIVDRLRRLPKRRILEVGCGTGQLANLLRDMQVTEAYLGIDFSQVAIEQARKNNPDWSFRCADIFEDQALEEAAYDVVISTEFLEHVADDLSVVARIRPGTMVIASVPNFPHKEHVRHFNDAQQVYDRYIGYFEELYVVTIPKHQIGLRHFLMQGRRKAA